MKKKMSQLLFLAMITISNSVFAIIPETNLFYSKSNNKELFKTLTESDLAEVADRITKIYSDFTSKNYNNAKLIIEKNWEDTTINAFAIQNASNEYRIYVTGGIVKSKGMTKNSLALILCHELGHHLGGAPHTHLYNGWPSAEGQADYWATSKCLKNYYGEIANEEVDITTNIPEKLITDCNKIYPDFKEMKICVRSLIASLEFANFINFLPTTKVQIKLDSPDPKVVKGTNINDYPKAQCRFDTLYQGALCNIPAFELTSQTDASVASCMDQNVPGARPKCWFAK